MANTPDPVWRPHQGPAFPVLFCHRQQLTMLVSCFLSVLCYWRTCTAVPLCTQSLVALPFGQKERVTILCVHCAPWVQFGGGSSPQGWREGVSSPQPPTHTPPSLPPPETHTLPAHTIDTLHGHLHRPYHSDTTHTPHTHSRTIHTPHTPHHTFHPNRGVLGQVVGLLINPPQGAGCRTLAVFLLSKARIFPPFLRISKFHSSEENWRVGEFIYRPHP